MVRLAGARASPSGTAEYARRGSPRASPLWRRLESLTELERSQQQRLPGGKRLLNVRRDDRPRLALRHSCATVDPHLRAVTDPLRAVHAEIEYVDLQGKCGVRGSRRTASNPGS